MPAPIRESQSPARNNKEVRTDQVGRAVNGQTQGGLVASECIVRKPNDSKSMVGVLHVVQINPRDCRTS